MKVRTGFVSNSSSSSFILALPHAPTSVEELAGWMFPDGVPEHISIYDNVIHGQEAVEAAFRDLKADDDLSNELALGYRGGSGSITDKQALADMISGTMYVVPKGMKWPEYPWRTDSADRYPHDGTQEEQDAYRERQRARWADHDAKKRVVAEALLEKLRKDHPDKQLFRVSYSDNDGTFNCVMEHGNVFKNLPGYRISHH